MENIKKKYVQKYLSYIFTNADLLLSKIKDEELELIFNSLTLFEEKNWKEYKTERFNWNGSQKKIGLPDNFSEPTIDILLNKIIQTEKLTTVIHKQWPNNKKFALCISHDMDHVHSYSIKNRFKTYYYYLFNNPSLEPKNYLKEFFRCLKFATIDYLKFLKNKDGEIIDPEVWLNMEKKYGFKSSLYILPNHISKWHNFDCIYSFNDNVIVKNKKIKLLTFMKNLINEGWEIGLHGSFYSATDKAIFNEQKIELENAIGIKVETTRQHYLQYDPNLTPIIHNESGIIADTTQGFNNAIGFRTGTCFPYKTYDWKKNEELSTWEIPLHIQDGPILRQKKTLDEKKLACVEMMNKVEATNGVLSILWHPFQLSTNDGLELFEFILNEAHKRNAWGCSSKELIKWWNNNN